MRPIVSSILVLCSALLLSAPAAAHHSFSAVYDSNKPIDLAGVVTKVDWMNPHIYYYIDVKGADGKVTNYAIEGGTPNQLFRRGWRRDSLKVGDSIKVSGFLAKDGSNHVNGRQTTLADGRRLFSGSTDDGAPVAPATR
jgi:hypothetical protein